MLSVLILIHLIGVIVTEVREKNGLVSAMITGEKILDDAYMDVGDRVESGTETEQTQDEKE